MNGLTQTGVTLENIGSLCRSFGLTVASKSEGRLEDLETALEHGKQVIVAVDGGELTGNQVEERIEDAFFGEISDHCVVVLTVEEDTVSLYDPAFGYAPLTVRREHFLDAWADSGCFYSMVGK